MPPHVDLVIVFRSLAAQTFSKQQIRDDARKAELQYTNLLDTLNRGGLRAVGRRGEREGQLLVCISCPRTQSERLAQRERHSDFLYGLPSSAIPSASNSLATGPSTSAERIRLVHEYITAAPAAGGLGITPGSKSWDLVESIMALHDHAFNEAWLKAWTSPRELWSVDIDRIREQFGDAVALYFAFLSAYTRALVFPAVLGVLAHFLLTSYSPYYATALLAWASIFVEWWRARERLLAVRWGTRGAARVEKRRTQYKDEPAGKRSWWRRDARVLASVPVIIGFAAILAAVLTGLFVLEAFVMHLYTGPGAKFVSLLPTILFIALVPPLTSIYQGYAQRFTAWENHAHQSTYDAALACKTFALSAIVAYLGLALSAFVYVPFGGLVMQTVQARVVESVDVLNGPFVQAGLSEKGPVGSEWWEADTGAGRSKLNAGRLQDQMFAYTVTNQAINAFMEIGLPYLLRFIDSLRNGKTRRGNGGKKKRVVFEEDEHSGGGGKEERAFLERVRGEAALPPYALFGDYSEMATQFGYVVLWSAIWPLAPAMALANNVVELRSDALKIVVHQRRPLPVRTDTVGPWLPVLSFLAWLGALTNAALVFLFRPRGPPVATPHATVLVGADPWELLGAAGVVALGASHGYAVVRWVVRRVVEQAVWRGSREVDAADRAEREVKEGYLRSVGSGGERGVQGESGEEKENGEGDEGFWGRDEGLGEIQKAGKDA